MMKKIMIAVFCVILITLCSCSKKTEEKNITSASSAESSVTVSSVSNETTEKEKETKLYKKTSTDESTIGNDDKTSSSSHSTTKKTKKNKTTSTIKNTTKGSVVSKVNEPTYVNGILIVNKTYALPEDYAPGVNQTALNAYNEMKAAAAEDGVTLYIISDYRPYSSQERIYNNYVSQDGKAAADRYSARPGHSEHQSGLAFDLNSLEQAFKNTKEGKWIAANCYKYGFIIRYPEGKESITGYMYEPWHIRYLGKETAEKVYKSGLTLEEYLGITSRYSD